MIEFLFSIIPASILINFIACIVLIYCNRRVIGAFLRTIDKSTYGALLFIFLLALVLRLFVPPIQHIVYVDEAWYMEAAKNLMQNGYQGVYPKSIGWPFLLSGIFLIFGLSNWAALYATIFIGSLTIVVLFLLGFVLTQKKSVGLLSSLMLAFYPVHIRWSAAAETNVAALFIMCLTFFLCVLYYQKPTRLMLWLSLSMLSFAAQFRPESYAIFGLFLVGDVLFNGKWIRRNLGFYLIPWGIFLLVSFSNLYQVLTFYSSTNFIVSDSQGLLQGSNWSIQNFLFNTKQYGVEFFNGSFQPIFIPTVFVIGLIGLWINKQRKVTIFLLAWFILFYLIYFSSWLVTMGGKERLLMTLYPPIIIFSSYGLVWLAEFFLKKRNHAFKMGFCILGIGFLTSSLIVYARKASTMYNGVEQSIETKIPEHAERGIPKSCVIIANWPTILKSTTKLNVVDINDFLRDKRIQKKILSNSSCVLFFQDYTCELWPSSAKNCGMMEEEFDMKDYLSYCEGTKKFSFYKISGKRF